MKLILLSSMMMLLQASVAAGPVAETKHLRYERAVPLQSEARGTVCAVLDAAVLAHAASRSADDLRLYANGVEVPFAMTENAPQPAEQQQATVQNLGLRDGAIVFDLAMPSRAYSEVDLTLDAKNFVATAEVSGMGVRGGGVTNLGAFTLFDLSEQKLSRSTALALQETTFPVLHVVLRMRSVDGKVLSLAPAMVLGAAVPPSREAQSLYTVVASTASERQMGSSTIATFNVPAHVPVERVSFVLDPAYKGDFLRKVVITDHASNPYGSDHFEGDILRVNRASSTRVTASIHDERLSVDALLGANLREPAAVDIAIENGDDKPLPIRAVQLEMRQRRICFAATEGSAYVLRYGDEALRAPVYDYARLFDASAVTAQAMLGAEVLNAQWVARADARAYSERHPELLWIGLVAVVAVLGATAVGSMKQQGKRG